MYTAQHTLHCTVYWTFYCTVNLTVQRGQSGKPILSGTQTSLSPIQCTAHYPLNVLCTVMPSLLYIFLYTVLYTIMYTVLYTILYIDAKVAS